MARIPTTTTPIRQTDVAPHDPWLADTPDSRLLARFLSEHTDSAERAFAELVRRHGPMVLGVCRNLLRNGHDAEDAFQATFLVFVRKARSIRRPELLGPWLHGVAVRVARKARAQNERRSRRETSEATMRDVPPIEDSGDCALGMVRREAIEALHEELARLPEKYRLPVVLCDLGGLTHREAASRLRWPAGSLSARLARARQLLRVRLTRRGVGTASALLITAAIAQTGHAAVPPRLARVTVRAGLRAAQGGLHAGCVSPAAASLAGRVLVTMARTKLAIWAGTGVLVLAVALGRIAPGPRTRQVAGGGPSATERTEARVGPPSRSSAPARRAPLRETGPAHGRDDPARQVVHSSAPPEERISVPPAPHDRDAAAQIQLALRSETRGRDADRVDHLSRAVLADPDHPTARGLLGQVRYGGHWRHVEAVPALFHADTGLAAALDAYRTRRARTPSNADAQYRLALWCEHEGLKPEATAHLIATTRLDAAHEGAWKRLGRKRVHGRWLTEAQFAEERAEHEDHRHWKPLLVKWRAWLGEKDRRAEAEQNLDAVADPHAARAVWEVFAAGNAPDHERAVRLFGQIDAEAATWALGVLAVASPAPSVRQVACETLARRNARPAISLLIGLLRDPLPNPDTVVYRFQFLPLGALGVGSPGVTVLETRDAAFVRFYGVVESRNWLTQSMLGQPEVLPSATYGLFAARQNAGQLRELSGAVAQAEGAALREILPLVASANAVNASAIQALRNVTGKDEGESWEAWKRWWTEGRGYAYDSQQYRNPPDMAFFMPKPTFASSVETMSCFAAGTPVQTLGGLQPIERIRVGDRLLTQDTTTGALSFEPVVAVHHNRPAATLRVWFSDGSIVATGIHRFWKAGRGWVMGRDLKPGDAVRTATGLAHVTKVEPDLVRPVFNLEVYEHQSFFAGPPGVLVHDNSTVEPVARPFDGAGTQPDA